MPRFLLLIFILIPTLIGLSQLQNFSPTLISVKYSEEIFHQTISDTPCIPKIDTLDGKRVYRKVEFAAEFPGGQAEFTRFLQKNLRYPAEQDDGQDRVSLTFIVDTSGNIRNPCVLNTPTPSSLSPFDSSVLSMFQSMPKWKPAEMNGKKVYYRHIQSINVHLE